MERMRAYRHRPPKKTRPDMVLRKWLEMQRELIKKNRP